MSALKLIALLLCTTQVIFAESEPARTLRPFRTDGCSAPLNLSSPSWTDCCATHDFAYWIGGDHDDKQRADAQLVNCLREKGLTGTIAAQVMKWAPQRLSEDHWGHRWDPPRPYGPLTAEDIKQVQKYEDSFSLHFPIAKRKTERKCTIKELPDVLRGLSNTICFDLTKINEHQLNNDSLVYSDDCIGYFIVHSQSLVEGFGACANLVTGLYQKISVNCSFSHPPWTDYVRIMREMKIMPTATAF